MVGSGFVSGAVFRFARGRVQLLSSLLLLLLLRSSPPPPTSNKVHDFFLNTVAAAGGVWRGKVWPPGSLTRALQLRRRRRLNLVPHRENISSGARACAEVKSHSEQALTDCDALHHIAIACGVNAHTHTHTDVHSLIEVLLSCSAWCWLALLASDHVTRCGVAINDDAGC